MQHRPTVGPGSQWTPFRECLPGAISKLGKGATLQRGQTWGGGGGGVWGGRMGMGGSGNGKARVGGSGDGKGNGPGRGFDGRGRGSGRWSGGGSGACGSGVRGNVSDGDFGDFGVSDVATVAGRYTRRGGPRLSVQGEPLVVLTGGP